MPGKVLDLAEIVNPQSDLLAVAIANKYVEFETYRNTWMNQKRELRNYLFATDTTTTTNSKLPWKNSTTTPKLTQIRDNLHANYQEALFPNNDWLIWEGDNKSDEIKQKREAIQSYMKTKFRQDNTEIVVARLLQDYIDYGNCFATVEWVDESTEDENGAIIRGYVGPRFVRISPFDIVFNPTVSDFKLSPKIIRSIKTIGELTKEAQKMPAGSQERKLLEAALDKSLYIRQIVGELSPGDSIKSDGFQMDGFSSMEQYYKTDYVEVLKFYGDWYDINTKTLHENVVITIIDRAYVVDNRKNPSWINVGGGIYHAAWRQRPDNLYGMGPLDNLVGMQYRIDHLENLKADVFDLIAYPVLKIKGYVEDFNYGPGARIYIGDEGDVEFMHPDATALNADNQIEVLERRMEELAGMPREAMGFRTPGEKTKFEVQLLDNAASRIFMNKIQHFERVFFEPLLNYALTLARQNMSATDIVRTLDSEIDAVIFTTISRDDITAQGILHPVGATEYAHRANQLQNLMGLINSVAYKDPAVSVHLSGKKIAQLMEELGDFHQFEMYGDNIRVIEQSETQRLMAAAQEQQQVQSSTPPGISEADPGTPPSAVPTGMAA